MFRWYKINMKPDPCQKQYDEWTKAADEAQRLKNEYDSAYAYKGKGETVQNESNMPNT